MRSIFWFLVGIALASPIENEPRNSVQKRSSRSDQNVYELERTYLGLQWDQAAETCSEDQMDILIEAVEEANKMTNFALQRQAMSNSPSWNRYFLNDDPSNLKSTWSTNFDIYKALTANMEAVANFPKKGKKNNDRRYNRVTLRCVPKTEVPERCGSAIGDKAGQAKAETGEEVNDYWTIHFCPYFFNTLKPIDYYASSKSFKESSLPSMKPSREHVVIHELMHCNVIGIQKTINLPMNIKSKIVDLEAAPPPYDKQGAKPVYMDGRCHAFAWQNKDDMKSINTMVAGNADNYAWFFTHFLLHTKLGWTDDGSTNFHSTKREQEEETTYDDDDELVNVSDITMTGDATTTGASTTTATPCEVQSFQVATGTEAFCACSTTSGTDTVTSTITTPSGGKCGDYTAFPSTGFMAKPTITADNEMCQFNFGSESKDGYCACQTTVSSSVTSQWVPLPYTMGSYTILDCHSITSVDFTSTTPTPTTSATKTFITDYTSEDIGNGNVYVFPTAYATVGTKNWAGDPNFTGVPETLGVGTATFEEVPNYSTTDGLTKYYYAEATGDGNGDVTPVGTPTAIALPSPTQKCIRYTIPDPSVGHYNSDKDQYIFVLYGISAWNTTAGQYEEKITGALEDCGVKDNISVEEDTGKWGTVAMWNSGRNWDMDDCITKNLDFLGAHDLTNDSCGGGLPNMNEDLEAKDSASEDMDYIESKFSDHVSSPYPLQS